MALHIEWTDAMREQKSRLRYESETGYAPKPETTAAEIRAAEIRRISEKELQVAQLQAEINSDTERLMRNGQAKEAATQASRMAAEQSRFSAIEHPREMSQEAARGYSDMQSFLRQNFHNNAWGSAEELRDTAKEIALNLSRSLAAETFYPGMKDGEQPSKERVAGMREGLMDWSHHTNHKLLEMERSHAQEQSRTIPGYAAAVAELDRYANGGKWLHADLEKHRSEAIKAGESPNEALRSAVSEVAANIDWNRGRAPETTADWSHRELHQQIDAAKQHAPHIEAASVAQPLHFRYRDEAMEFAKTADGPFSFRVPNASESAMLYATINDLSRPQEQHATVRPHANWEPSYKDLQPALAPAEVAQQHSFSRSGASFGMGAE